MPIQPMGRSSGRLAALGAILLAAAGPARAQDWREYAYPDAGFSAQFPVRPTVAELQYKAGGLSAPAMAASLPMLLADRSTTVTL